MTLIGLGGAARAGKDAFAEILKRDYGFSVIGMSDPLRAALETLDPWVKLTESLVLPDGSRISPQTMRVRSILRLAGYSTAKTVPEVRRLLQSLGTDVVRKMVDEDAWVNATRRKIMEESLDQTDRFAAWPNNTARVVVTGIRFDNELEMISELGGLSAYVVRYKAMEVAPSHSSEFGVLVGDFDRRIDNNGTLAALEHHAHELMKELNVTNVLAMSYDQR